MTVPRERTSVELITLLPRVYYPIPKSPLANLIRDTECKGQYAKGSDLVQKPSFLLTHRSTFTILTLLLLAYSVTIHI